MKENIMKQFALATIDKVQEMKEAADKAGLYLSVGVNLATESNDVAIYELAADGKNKMPSIFFKCGCYLDKPGCKKFAAMLQEAADFIANYDKDSLASLEKEQAELRERLAAVNKGLRKARRAAK
jgi:chaperonin cofactor prefoldin